jgi:RNA polymerase sigma-70 factor, ECF subfamily
MITKTDDHSKEQALEAVRSDDPAAFSSLLEPHRRELQVHCYRLLASFDEAEDLVQETFLRAWRKRETYAARASLRAWLYRIATNACLDALDKRAAEPPRAQPAGEVPWLQHFPDRLLDELEAAGPQPDALVVERETIELAFLIAVQQLPPRQRAVLVLRDVLGWPARDAAELLETTVPAANSALQRARATLRGHLPERRAEWAPATDPTSAERDLLRRYMDATDRGDAQALAATLREDVRFSMPPDPFRSVGRAETVGAWVQGGFGSPEWGELRCLATRANRQPAVMNYARLKGSNEFEPFALDVLRIEEGLVAEIVTFVVRDPAALGLPARP